ncbi:P-loop containing nucleoside triphosphate hydrolase protein [Marasmius fiardii PR-910]|nr:P-loop containing nucleoside triphosphate hydrolase protein [Marasmius fiardii PR-910]
MSWWASGSQVVMQQTGGKMMSDNTSFLYDSALLPTYASAISLSSLVIVTLSKILRGGTKTTPEIDSDEVEEAGNLEKHIISHGGTVRFSLQVLRFILSIALMCLGGLTLTTSDARGPSVIASHIGLAYICLLSLIVVVTSPKWSEMVTRHVNLLLVTTLLVYTYRDLFPLATYTLHPQDHEEGVTLWWKIGLITGAAALPLGMPRQYKPVNPNKPSSNPNPEQTATLFSLIFFFYLDPVMFAASRVKHLAADQLPPLADYDAADHLRGKMQKYIPSFNFRGSSVPNRSQPHIFWTLLWLVRSEYIWMTVTIFIHTSGKFVVPVSVNQLLRHMETNNQDSFMRPWFWVAMIFVAPNIASMAIERYMFLACRVLSHAGSVLSQVVFAHSLRIRMKAETQTPLSPKHTPNEQTENQRSSNFKPATGPSSLVGKINNLITTDVNNVLEGPHLPFLFTYVPLNLIWSLLFLYSILGWSALVAFGATLTLLPIPLFLAKLIHKVQEEKMKRTDERVQLVSETTKVIRMVKLFGWEAKMSEAIAEKREEELKWTRRLWFLQALSRVVKWVFFASLREPIGYKLTFGQRQLCDTGCNNAILLFHLTVIMKEELRPSVVFSSVAVFDSLRVQCGYIVHIVTKLIVAKVSLDRINDFLIETELLDAYTPNSTYTQDRNVVVPEGEIAIHEAFFTWTAQVKDSTSSDPPSLLEADRRFVLMVDKETLKFKRGCLNLIVGPTGSGKTSLLMALLGEMHYIPVAKDSYISLPRTGGIAYVAQESWVQNETIRENIIFGSPFDEGRYNKVIHQCGLERDLTLFQAGDKTEVGEKGITLSGGQKARITLARAVYSTTEILLLDDVLAALDVHTAKWVVDKCFKGDLIKGRTVLLVTHNIPLVAPLADFVVSVKDGKIMSQGSLDAALREVESLVKEVEEKTVELKNDKETAEEEAQSDETAKPGSDGKLIVAEEVQFGRVDSSIAKMYASAFGGNHPFLTIGFCVCGLLAAGGLNVVQTWYLGYWAKQYDIMPPSSVPVVFHLGIYGLILLAAVIVSALTYAYFAVSAVRASRILHVQLIQSVLTTTLRWLDTTPVSRILARCTGDINAVDLEIPESIQDFGVLATRMFTQLIALVTYTPIFIPPAFVLMVLGKWCGDVFTRAVMCVRREWSNSKAPVLAQFDGALAGIVSIRAYGVEEAFEAELRRRVDENVRISRTFWNIGRWMPTRTEFLGALFSSCLAGYLVYFSNVDPSAAGFSLNMSVTFTSAILFFIFRWIEVEISANSLERIDAYLNIEREPGSSSTGEPPAYWPAGGDLRVENLSARYSPDGPKVLHNLNFHIRSGERIGVVGRTGSGKSSLTLSLLRCIYTEGNMYYDGINTIGLNLDALRSKITIIPQMPELLSGTLRQNLDPFGEHDDVTLNDVLRASGLVELQKTKDQDRLTLDSGISSGGTNLSVGQRQILALARAFLRKSKLLILDEATSAIDYETDTIIQQSLRNELGSDTTVITIAHRLQTIMDADRIMVLDAGRIVEFDTPQELLKRGGVLAALVEESADKDALVDMASKAVPLMIVSVMEQSKNRLVNSE